MKWAHSMMKFIKSKPFVHFILFGLILSLAQVFALPGVGILPTSFARGPGYFMIVAIIVLGYYVLLGHAGLASLGTAGFVGLGTYMTGFLLSRTSIPPFIILIICILLGILLGIVVGFISLRIEGMYLAIITLGLSEILVVVFKNFTAFTGGISGLNTYGITPSFSGLFDLGSGTNLRPYVYFLTVVIFVIIMILTYNLIKSPVGRAMLAMKNSESAAQAMGVSLLKYRLLAFVVTTVYCMIAGFLYMYYYAYSNPLSWNLNLSLNILAAVVIGGTSSIWGILLGAFIVFSLNDIVLSNIVFFQQNPNTIILINGLLMILVVMFYPGGISQLIFQTKLKIKAWQLKRQQKGKPEAIDHA
jgi:branched-chain amino acid transport system permease protein